MSIPPLEDRVIRINSTETYGTNELGSLSDLSPLQFDLEDMVICKEDT